ncbi:putative conserved transmembrane protein [Actinokineospora spheciospongiae]|uniref:Putative conserved transmembrane protein n=1 Tax=Actinokineospora spheciospongiae TaxID=909613 RepID=W7IGS4_9PSEU|nr:type II secretion system F family protein [Actinokineospora spheciospongiae]EWC59493.1 putative conserved transmembrane protein [Actinokineospora spheciospongiae]
MLGLLFVAGAVLSWPSGAAARRLRALRGPRVRRWAPPRPRTVLVVAGCGLVGWVPFGAGGAVAACIAGVSVWRGQLARRRSRETLAGIEGFAESVRALVSELTAGAHPATAAEHAAVDADPASAKALRAAAAAARLGGGVGAALARAELPATLSAATRRVGRAWDLAGRHGLPLAEVLDAVRRDLDHRARFAHQVDARMAGPRTSAAVLAALPVLGVLLGEAMGAAPLAVFTTPAGQVLLVLGVALAAAGVAWTSHLTGQVVFR